MKPGIERRGFTFVELLLVITLIGILVALLLPAVQAASEAARRRNCASNLGQLILAVHQYEMAHGVYPPGSIEPRGPILNWPRGYHQGWLVQLLPQLDSAAVQRNVDFRQGVYDPVNRDVYKSTLRVLHCPSDAQLPARSNYAAVHHDRESPIDVANNGVFFLNSRVRHEQVSDGLSHTLFLGEKMIESNDMGWMSGTRATLRNTNWAATGAAAAPPAFPLDDDGLPMYVPQLERELFQAASDAGAAGGQPGPSSSRQPKASLLFVGGFSAAHPGGAQYTFGDGSVRFLSNTIDPPTYQRLGHRSDGRPLDEGKYH
ncbi:MAG: DUF1559 domain-containing protein [Pirellulaceae bacterium]|nr:DUF1559 domain-containing protein [Pirellulaceae bacterium]